jgi:small-conductance mechanosensitive channel
VKSIELWTRGFLTAERAAALGRAAVILFVGLIVARLAARWLRHLVGHRGDPQRAILVGRLVGWAVAIFALAGAMQELGFQLGVLLGAAGVMTVAIGFASQTTLSNLISGFFLFGERPFGVGDVIEIDNVTGEVLSVDMMSTKLRTFDNRYVRIPNEAIIKTKVMNHTRFPIRRLDLSIRIARDEDFERVRQLLLDVADDNLHALDEPAPIVFIDRFGEATLDVMLSVWTETSNMVPLRTTLGAEIQSAFLAQKVRAPALPGPLAQPSPTP